MTRRHEQRSTRPELVIIRDLPADELAALTAVAAQLRIPVADLIAHAIRLRARLGDR